MFGRWRRVEGDTVDSILLIHSFLLDIFHTSLVVLNVEEYTECYFVNISRWWSFDGARIFACSNQFQSSPMVPCKMALTIVDKRFKCSSLSLEGINGLLKQRVLNHWLYAKEPNIDAYCCCRTISLKLCSWVHSHIVSGGRSSTEKLAIFLSSDSFVWIGWRDADLFCYSFLRTLRNEYPPIGSTRKFCRFWRYRENTSKYGRGVYK